MYIIIAVMGNCLAGARATSHAFLSLSMSVSSTVGGVRRATVLEFADVDFCKDILLEERTKGIDKGDLPFLISRLLYILVGRGWR